MDDSSYEFLFRPIMSDIMARFQPDAVVLQSGAWGWGAPQGGRGMAVPGGRGRAAEWRVGLGRPPGGGLCQADAVVLQSGAGGRGEGG